MPNSYRQGFIIEATESEVSQVMGGASASSLKTGDVINVSDLYNHLNSLSHAGGDIVKAAAMLRAAASLLETAPAPFSPVKPAADA